jgi:hypothetical protein
MLLCSTVKPLRVALVEPVAYPWDSYGYSHMTIVMVTSYCSHKTCLATKGYGHREVSRTAP